MHHNLSALEDQIPLVASSQRLYSPWKREERAASGVLHGIYVFVCLVAYFRQPRFHDGILKEHARARVEDIVSEINRIERDTLHQTLTPAGQEFCRALYAGISGTLS